MPAKDNKALDIIKYVSSILIVCLHCQPVFRTEIINVYLFQWLCRFCVPLFFISAGFYFYRFSEERKKKYIIRLLIIYAVASLIYLPFNIRESASVIEIIKNLLFGYYHLWYLSALIISLCIVYILNKLVGFSRIFIFAGLLLWIAGVFLDEYYKFLDNSSVMTLIYYLGYIGGVRHILCSLRFP